MRIEQVNIYRVLLPFSVDFSHSLRKRSSVNNIVVEIVADRGDIAGYGEGAPRVYVTGESQESAAANIRAFAEHRHFPWDLESAAEIWDFVDGLPREKEYNTAVCALETALLDALGKSQNRYLTDYFSRDFFTDTIHYGAAVPLDSRQTVMALSRLIKHLGVSKLKLKLGRNLKQNRDIFEGVHQVFGHDCELKIDINCVWDLDLALAHVPLIQQYHVRIVEQPMMPDSPEISALAARLQPLGVVLMADESACCLRDIEEILDRGHYGMINVRLSKCGGFRRSLEMIACLRNAGLPFQIGCQLGESGLLSSAGRVLSLLNRDALYFDGSYDEYLLKENITVENVYFGPGGKAGPLYGPGLGVDVDRGQLTRLTPVPVEEIPRPV